MLYTLISTLFQGVRILIILRIILSWIAPNSHGEFVRTVYHLSEPILKPFRVIIPLGGAYLDLAPIIVFFLISFLERIVFRIIFF